MVVLLSLDLDFCSRSLMLFVSLLGSVGAFGQPGLVWSKRVGVARVDCTPVVESHWRFVWEFRFFSLCWPAARSRLSCFFLDWLQVIGIRPLASASALRVSAELFGSGLGWSWTPFAWKNIASLVWRQKCVTGYPQWPLQGIISSLPSHLLFGHCLPCCFFLALSHICGLKWTLEPSCSFMMHRFEQTITPRQDFLRMCMLWLFVFRIAQPDACLLACSSFVLYTHLEWPSAHSLNVSHLVTFGIELSLMSQPIELADCWWLRAISVSAGFWLDSLGSKVIAAWSMGSLFRNILAPKSPSSRQVSPLAALNIDPQTSGSVWTTFWGPTSLQSCIFDVFISLSCSLCICIHARLLPHLLAHAMKINLSLTQIHRAVGRRTLGGVRTAQNCAGASGNSLGQLQSAKRADFRLQENDAHNHFPHLCKGAEPRWNYRSCGLDAQCHCQVR